MDEAAEKYAKENCENYVDEEDGVTYIEEALRNTFKAGVEWMAGQVESIESTVVTTQDEDTGRPYLALQNFGYVLAPIFCKEGNKVIVQIRKKEE